VRRATDGALVASQAVTDGHVCIQGSAVVVAPCLSGETKRVQVRRHRFTHGTLHVTNVCIV
jgi:hypothetical protein